MKGKGWMYILACADGSYYTGSTVDLYARIQEHNHGEGANHTKKRLPVHLVYAEEFSHVSFAFNREKQVQGWRREKKEALIHGAHKALPEMSIAYRDQQKISALIENFRRQSEEGDSLG